MLHNNQRFIAHRQRDTRLRKILLRPEIEPVRRNINEVFAGTVQLFEQVDRAPAARRRIALAHTVLVRHFERDPALRGIDSRHAYRIVVPVEAPEPVQPHALLHPPARGAVAFILKHAAAVLLRTRFLRIGRIRDRPVVAHRSFVDDFGDRRPALVRPAGQRHAAAVDKQLRDAERQPEIVARRRGLREPQRVQISAAHLPARRRIEAFVIRPARKPLKRTAGDRARGSQKDRRARRGRIDDRRTLRAGVFRAHFKAAGQHIASGMQHHLGAARQRSGFFCRAHRIARPLKRRERLGGGPCARVIAVRPHMKHARVRTERTDCRPPHACQTEHRHSASQSHTFLSFFSSASSHALRDRPPSYPTRLPSAPITRWHGMTIATGLRLLAIPTARAALGFPTAAATR